MKKLTKIIIYICGLSLLAVGIVLNTKANLGVSPISTIPYTISIIFNINFGTATASIYILYVFGQIAILRKEFHPIQILQIPLSFFMGLLINYFNTIIMISSNNFFINLILLTTAIFFTGLGAALILLMDILPNAADGLVLAVSQKTGKELGFVKNVMDVSCMVIALIIGVIFSKSIIGIGVGTILAAIGVGRTITYLNLLFKEKWNAFIN